MSLIIITGCHTLEHKNLFLVTNNSKSINPEKVTPKDVVKAKIISKTIILKDKVSKTDLELVAKTKKKVSVYDTHLKKIIRRIDLKVLKNISEKELYSKIRQGDFIKEEGKMKNIQYYFSQCFLDVFLIKIKNVYTTDFIQIRATKLNSYLDKEKGLIEISGKIK